MGLFSGKKCVRCGKKAGLLSRERLASGEYLCSDCVDLCSPELTSDDFHLLTLEEVEGHIKACRKDAKRYKNDFEASETIRVASGLSSMDVIYVDETHGWWVNATVDRPDIFTFGQIGGCRLELETSTVDEDDEEKDEDKSALLELLDGIEEISRHYEGLPVCPPGEKIEKMTFHISIVRHPPISEVCISLLDTAFPTESDIESGYDAARELMTFFKEKKAEWKAQKKAKAAAGGGKAAGGAKGAKGGKAAGGARGGKAKGAKAAKPVDSDVTDQLLKLKQLLDAGVLTQEEFDAKKKQILGL